MIADRLGLNLGFQCKDLGLQTGVKSWRQYGFRCKDLGLQAGVKSWGQYELGFQVGDGVLHAARGEVGDLEGHRQYFASTGTPTPYCVKCGGR